MGLKRAIAYSFVLLGLVTSFASTIEPAYACSCAVAAGTASVAAGHLSFLGRVAELRPVPAGRFPTDMLAVGFVTRQGSDGATVDFQQVLTPASEAACGYSFTLGKTYQVDAQRDAHGYLLTDSCSTTQVTTRTIPVVMYPNDPDMQHQQLHLEWSYPYLLVLGIMAVIAIGAATLIRLRKRATRHLRA